MEVQEQATPETGGQVEDKKENSAEAKGAEKKTDDSLESFKAEMKKEIAGLNRKVSTVEKEKAEIKAEYEKKIQEYETAKMNDQEKAAYEVKLAKEEAEKERRDAKEFRLERIRLKALIEAGLDMNDAPLIGGASEEEIIERVKQLKDRVESLAAARVEAEVKKRFDAAGKPGGGDKSNTNLTYADLLKMTDEQIKQLPPGTVDTVTNAALNGDKK
jgi:hypothetical protein